MNSKKHWSIWGGMGSGWKPLIGAVFIMVFLPGANSRAGLIMEWGFNETGTTSPSSGSDTSSLTFRNGSNAVTDLHSAAGGGLTGQSWDRAFDNSASTSMGGTGGSGKISADISALDSLKSFTLMGWVNVSTVIGSNARLFYYRNETTGVSSIDLVASATGVLKLGIDGVYSDVSSTSYNATNSWMFFAVTFDGTNADTSQRVQYYVGSTSSSVASAGAGSSTDTVTNAGSAQTWSLSVGNTESLGRALDGSMDNFRIYGSSADGSGALSMSAIESVRSLDAVPEPGTMACLLMGGVMLFFCVFRKARSRG